MLVVILTENCGFEIHYILCHYDWWSKYITCHNLSMYHAVPRLTMRTKPARKEITYLTLRRPYLGLECRGLCIPQTKTFWKNSRLTKQTGPRVDSWVMNANVPSFMHCSASLYHLSLRDGICHHDGLKTPGIIFVRWLVFSTFDPGDSSVEKFSTSPLAHASLQAS